MDRRRVLACGAALALPGVAPAASGDLPTLRSIADTHHRLYGTAVSGHALKTDPDYARLVARQAAILVAEGETKRSVLQPAPDRFDFSGADDILGFAEAHGQRMRGHTLVWFKSNPPWLEQALAQSRDDRLLTSYVASVAGRYAGRFQSWDVVNEVVAPDDGDPSGTRVGSPWFKAFGSHYIDLAFEVARAADPKTPLFLNEENLEADAPWAERRRRATLALLETLLKRNVPIDGLGIQGHLKPYRFGFSDEIFARFVDAVTAMGLKVLITEFDIADVGGPADPAQRDADAAALARRFLSVTLPKSNVLGCITWGITDRYTWLSKEPGYRRTDGQPPRALPFDADLKPKPLFEAIAAGLRSG